MASNQPLPPSPVMGFTYLYIDMYGGPMTDAINGDFEKLDTKIGDIDKELSIRIISNQIQEIKEENGVVSYTTDNGNTWTPLTPSWGKIQGNIQDQTDLIDYLKRNFADLKEFTKVKNDVSAILLRMDANEENITNLLRDVSDLKTKLDDPENGLIFRVTTLEEKTADMVHSPNINSIRLSEETGEMEYSEDGTTWKPMKTGVEWGDIYGDIEDNLQLYSRFNNINKRLDDLEGNESSYVQSVSLEDYARANKTSNKIYIVTDTNN